MTVLVLLDNKNVQKSAQKEKESKLILVKNPNLSIIPFVLYSKLRFNVFARKFLLHINLLKHIFWQKNFWTCFEWVILAIILLTSYGVVNYAPCLGKLLLRIWRGLLITETLTKFNDIHSWIFWHLQVIFSAQIYLQLLVNDLCTLITLISSWGMGI